MPEINLPENLTSNILDNTSSFLGSFSPLIYLLLGFLIAFFIGRKLFEWLQDTIEKRRELQKETAIIARLRQLGVTEKEIKDLVIEAAKETLKKEISSLERELVKIKTK
jgi:flagellar biosynthesis/type III secretory pathway M-ring protein FliF/YscJ